MRPILRGVATGLVAGVAFYFFPFLFRFLFFILLITLMIRLFRGGRRRRFRYAHAGRPPFVFRDGYYQQDPISIDGYQHRGGTNQGPEQHIPVQ